MEREEASFYSLVTSGGLTPPLRHISGIGYIEVNGRKLERRIENPSNVSTFFTKKSIDKMMLVILIAGIFIFSYPLISRVIIFLKGYNYKKDAPGINNSSKRRVKDNNLSLEQRYLNIFGLNEKFSVNELKKTYFPARSSPSRPSATFSASIPTATSS